MIWTADDYQERPGLRMNPAALAERLKTGFAWLEGREPDDALPVRSPSHNRPSNTPHTHKAA